jgi:DNA-binding response OmpR family regulator
MRVLVAEDDEGLRSVLVRGLRENGYAVDSAADGRQALRYLDTYEYEVAILDWRMPEVTGLEVVQQLRRRGSALPVLMLTARDTAGDRVMGLDQGADDYLVKPFHFGELLARVRALQRRDIDLAVCIVPPSVRTEVSELGGTWWYRAPYEHADNRSDPNRGVVTGECQSGDRTHHDVVRATHRLDNPWESIVFGRPAGSTRLHFDRPFLARRVFRSTTRTL